MYIYGRSVPRLMDIFFWPVTELLVWGFLSVFINKMNLSTFNAVTVFLGAILFWGVVTQGQKSVSVTFLEDVWEKNFLNMFVTPLRLSEFLSAAVFLSALRILVSSALMAGLGYVLYRFNIFTFGVQLVPFMANLMLFGMTLGVLVISVILRYGSSAQILAWGFIVLVQPFSAVFYPVSVLPHVLQYICWAIPSTYVFEGMRILASTGHIDGMSLITASVLNVLYFGVAICYFYRMFAAVKVKGRLMKLD